MKRNSKLANARYSYMHADCGRPHEELDAYHIVIQRNKAWVFLVYIFVILSMANAFCFYWGILGLDSFWSMPFCPFLVYLFYQKHVVKESVVIIPTFGVQLETHYRSGRVLRRFIPVEKILKPVLNEHVTPITCYWSLALVVRGKEELVLVFKNVQPPVKMLVPIWKALCAATDVAGATDTASEEDR